MLRGNGQLPHQQTALAKLTFWGRRRPPLIPTALPVHNGMGAFLHLIRTVHHTRIKKKNRKHGATGAPPLWRNCLQVAV